MSYKPNSRLYYTQMVYIVPTAYCAPANPTRTDIDTYIHDGYGSAAADTETLRGIVREIQCKSGAGALLHPAEEYFVEAVALQ